jgi:hypothetical protein
MLSRAGLRVFKMLASGVLTAQHELDVFEGVHELRLVLGAIPEFLDLIENARRKLR